MLQSSILSSVLQTWSAQGKLTRVPVQGDSMTPLLQPGDTLVVQCGAPRVRFGDLILRWAASQDAPEHRILLAHRVVKMGRDDDGWWYITKGDRCPRFDPPARSNDLVGKVVAIETGQVTADLVRRCWIRLGWLVALRSMRSAR
jgi:signal peptidase I